MEVGSLVLRGCWYLLDGETNFICLQLAVVVFGEYIRHTYTYILIRRNNLNYDQTNKLLRVFDISICETLGDDNYDY